MVPSHKSAFLCVSTLFCACFAARTGAVRDGQVVTAHMVLSRAELSPSSRGGSWRVQFSPNGQYILLQDESSVRVCTREPLEEVVRVGVEHVLPAVFSADSKRVLITSPNLKVEVIDLAVGGRHEIH